MEVKVSYKGKIKKAKDVDCLDLPSLKAWLLERHSDMPSESLLAYIPDRETGIYNIDSEETYQAMRAKHKKIRLFIDPSKEELD
jgi:DNA topoisomerase IB